MSQRIWFLILMLTIVTPFSGRSCEPIIVPLYYLLSGSTLAGSAILTDSLYWLAAAVVVKSLAFILFEKRLPWWKAALLMVVANVLSTIPGIFLAVLTSSGTEPGIILAMPLVFGLGWIVQKRVSRIPNPSRRPKITGGTALAAFIAFFTLSMVLYGFATNVLHEREYSSYWVLKFLFVTLVACSGIAISAVLEECVIAGMARGSAGNISFYTSVIRANYITLGLVLLVAAIQILPQRLKSPNFITGLIDGLWGAIGRG